MTLNYDARLVSLVGDALIASVHNDQWVCASSISPTEVVSYLRGFPTPAFPVIRPMACDTRVRHSPHNPAILTRAAELKYRVTDNLLSTTTSQGSLKSGLMTAETSYEASKLEQVTAPARTPVRDFGLSEFFARPVYLSTMTLPAEGVSTEMYPFTQYVANTVVADKLKYFRIINATLHVRAEIALTPHHYGWAHVILTADTAMANGIITSNRLLSIPGTTMDFSVSNPVELSRRLFTPGVGVDLNVAGASWNGTSRAASLIFCTVAGLARDDGVAVGTQLVKVYAWLTDVELSGPSIYSVASGDPVGEMAIAEAEMNEAGRQNRLLNKPPDRVSNALLDNMASSDIPSTASTLAVHSDRSVTRDAIVEDVDTLSKEFWYNLWGYVGSFTWATTDAPGSQLQTIPVTPTLNIKAVGPPLTYSFAPIGIYALGFWKWTGSLRIRLRCSATAFHRGRLMVVYTPNTVSSAAVVLSTLTATGENEILDVASGFDKVFCVRWSQPETSGKLDSAQLNQIPSAYFSNGTLRVVVVDPLAATTAGASLSISVWIAGDKDTHFEVPGGYTDGYSIASSSVPMAFDQQLPDPSAREMGCFPLDSSFLKKTFGEDVSLRDLLSKPTLDLTLQCSDVTPPTSQFCPTIRTDWPVFPWLADSAGAASAYTGVGTGNPHLSPLTAIASCFSGFRGNVRHKVYAIFANPNWNQPRFAVVAAHPSVGKNIACTAPRFLQMFSDYTTASANFLFQDVGFGAVTVFGGANVSLVADVEVAPRDGNRLTAFNQSSEITVSEYGFRILENTGGSGGGTVYGSYAHLSSVGKDFQFVNFCGVPPLQASTNTYPTGSAFT